VLFLPARPDIEWYYAAADAYVGPSLEDAFALPPLEAMACGIPAVTSRQAGVSEVLTHGLDGLILEEATDSHQLSLLIDKLISDPAFYSQLAENAAKTARQYTWEKNAELLFSIFLSTREDRH
jgi:glycosyltransferase involved in cell wall biosynthesis